MPGDSAVFAKKSALYVYEALAPSPAGGRGRAVDKQRERGAERAHQDPVHEDSEPAKLERDRLRHVARRHARVVRRIVPGVVVRLRDVLPRGTAIGALRARERDPVVRGRRVHQPRVLIVDSHVDQACRGEREAVEHSGEPRALEAWWAHHPPQKRGVVWGGGEVGVARAYRVEDSVLCVLQRKVFPLWR